MHCVTNIREDLYWLGGSDRQLAKFENVFPIPRGVSYNAYLLLDEKTVLLDTVDKAVGERFFENLEFALAGRPLDYVVVNHMEPDHCATLGDLLRRPRVGYADLAPFDPDRPDLPPDAAEQVEISVKYAGYIQRQQKQVEDFRKMERRRLPPDLDYSAIQGLRLEAREKLNAVRPADLGQASRISGVSPADVTALMIYLER